jgi:DNA-binding MarR family transcriptional regulator
MSAPSRKPEPRKPERRATISRPSSPPDSTYDLGSSETRELFPTLARTALYLDALQRESLREHRLSFSEYSVLRLLQRAPKRRLAPSILAEAIVCTSGAMTKLVDRLEKAGHVSRSPDPNDRRGVLVRLEATGNRVANAAARSYQKARDRVLGQLDPSSAESIQMNLQRLLEALETDRNEHE